MEPNITDIINTDIICGTIMHVVLIVVAAFILWNLIEHVVNAFAAWYKRKCDKEDKKRKRDAELLSKYLDFLKDQTKDKTVDADKPKTENADQADINTYEKVLKKLVDLKSSDESNQQSTNE